MKKISKKLKKALAILLLVLTVVSALKFLIFKPKTAFASSTLGLNEGYGTTIKDNNGNITGTITNATWKQKDLCKFENCLYFDGTGDLVNFGDDADLDHIAADNFTIEGWFRTPNITSGTRVLVSKYNSATSTDGGYKVYMDSSGYLIFGIDDDQTSFPEDSASSSTTAFDDNKWHYFAAVKTGTTSITLYVDGIQYQTDSSISATGTLANTDIYHLGIDGDGSSNGFSGFLDEVTIHNTARSTAEIKTDLAGETPSRGAAAVFGPDQSRLSDGLLGYWKMDESSWTNNCSTGSVLDSSGNSNNATSCPNTTGPTGASTGKFGKSGNFDGSDDYLESTSASLLLSNSVTVSSWINVTSAGSTARKYIVNTTNSNQGYALTQTDTTPTMKFSIGDGASYVYASGATTLTTGVWYHVVGTADNQGNVKVYVNGILDGENTATGPMQLPSGVNFRIGTRSTSNYFNGLIDETRVYNRAFSPNEVAQLYKFAPGPIMNWSMDEGSWTVDCSTISVFDRSGYGNNGTACPNSTGPTGGSSGMFGKAGIFDGTQDYINIPTFSGLPSGSGANWTLSAWVKTTVINGSNHVIMSYGDGLTTGASPHIALSDTNKWRVSTWGTGTSVDSNATPVTNKWTHIAGTSDGTILRLYVNGVLDNQGTPASISPLTTNLRIGSSPRTSPTIFWGGTIDNALIYNYARTPAQIIEDMNGGHPAPGSPVGSTVATWKMNEGYGTTAHDNSINANDLTLSTASWTNSGIFGKAFNGLTNVRLSRSDDADLDFLGDEDFSFSLWFKSDSATNPSANEYLLEKGGNITTDAIGYAIYTSAASDGLICFGIDDDATNFPEDSVCSTSDLYDNTWHHIVAKKTGTTSLDLFVDGKPNGSPDTAISATGTLANASTFYIGDTNGTDGTDEFLGDIDEVQIYRSALSNASILAVFNQGSGTTLGSLSTDSSNNASNSDTNSYCPPGQGSTCTPPVGEWKLDENTGLVAYDTGTNVNNGTISTTNNPPRWSPGVFGGALRFPGTTGADAVSMGDPANLDFGTNSFTLQFWMKVDGSTGTTQVPVYKGGPSSTTVGYDVEINSSNVLKWHYGDGTAPNYVSINITDDISPYFGKWVFITCVVDRTSNISSVYFNGKFITSTSIAGYGTVDNTRNFQLGNYHSGTLPFLGSIDEIKVYNYARTPAQIAWDMNRGAPIGWWKLDESSGTAYDSSGNGFALTNTASTFTTGKFNNSGSFNGTTSYLSCTDAACGSKLEPGTSDFSISAWIKTSTTGATQNIVRKQSSATTDGYFLRINSSNQADFNYSDGSTNNSVQSSDTITDNTWHHIVAVADRSVGITIYVDGKLSGTTSFVNTGTIGDGESFAIGTNWNSGSPASYFTGNIDDVRYYNYTLTTAQIKTIMNNGAAVKY